MWVPQVVSLKKKPYFVGGRDGAVGTATRYGMDGSWIESGRGSDFSSRPDRTWGLPIMYKGYGVLPEIKWPERGAVRPPPPNAELPMDWAATPTPLRTCTDMSQSDLRHIHFTLPNLIILRMPAD